MLRSVKYGLYGLLLAGMVAVPAIWNGVDKTVHLVVDGKATTVSTTADRVGDLLSDRGYKPDSHDIVAPSVRTALDDGMHVVLRRGRLLHLDVDGRRTDVWTTAPTVAIALQQLGYNASDFVSVSRSRRLPLSPTAIDIRSLRTVTIVHDGQSEQVSTTEPTVQALLASIGMNVGAQDRTNVPMTAAVTDGQTIVIQRVLSRTVMRTIELKYGTQQRKDASMAFGDTTVVTSGRNGSAHVYYSNIYVDGKLIGSTKVRTDVVRAPRTKIVAIGTDRNTVQTDQGNNVPTGGSSPSAAQAIARQMLAARGWSDQFSCLDNIYSRESGWRVHAENSGSGAYGIPQALPGSKMASAGSDWQDSAATQIAWGLNYIKARYGDPCGAWSFWQNHNYY